MKHSIIKANFLLFLICLGSYTKVHTAFNTEELPVEELKNAIQEQDIATIITLIDFAHNVEVIPFLEAYVANGHAWACYLLLKRLAGSYFGDGSPKDIVQGLQLVIMLEILTKMAECTVKKERSEELNLVWKNIFSQKVNQYFYSVSCQGVVISDLLGNRPDYYDQALTNVKTIFTKNIQNYCKDVPPAYWVSTVSWKSNLTQGVTWGKPTAAQKTLFVDNLFELAQTSQEKGAQENIIVKMRRATYESVVSAYERTIAELRV